MLAAAQISKSFGGVPALRHVDIEVRPHEVVGLIGENGAGKSTLMRILAGTHRPDSGSLTLDGQPPSVLGSADIETLFARVRALKSRASFVFVSHRLDEVLRISDRVYVMKDGEVVAERPAGEVTGPQLHQIMVGRGLHTEYYKE